MRGKLLSEHRLEFLSVKVGYTGSSESTLVKLSHCWKSHVTAQNQNYKSTKGTEKQQQNHVHKGTETL